MNVVAVCGYKGSGKDTFVDALGADAAVSLADPLKKAAAAMFAFSNEQVYGGLKDEVDARYGFTPRQVLQWLGTEFAQFRLGELSVAFRELMGRGLWIRRAIESIEELSQLRLGDNVTIESRGARVALHGPLQVVAVPDLRFVHEAEALSERFGNDLRIVRIYRPGYDSDGHASESEVEQIPADFVVANDGTLAELRASASVVSMVVRRRLSRFPNLEWRRST